ncbi:hypothetical protein AB1L88_26610 [Tautonia sp. JC769]|uniref:hypothetical protein n=1 Tax=Tautonia sp. JC769 TaxID=3232135 RepID=UPI0034594138
MIRLTTHLGLALSLLVLVGCGDQPAPEENVASPAEGARIENQNPTTPTVDVPGTPVDEAALADEPAAPPSDEAAMPNDAAPESGDEPNVEPALPDNTSDDGSADESETPSDDGSSETPSGNGSESEEESGDNPQS